MILSAGADTLATMSYDLSPNEKPVVKVERVGREQQPVVVVDGILRDPESVVRLAVERLRFVPAQSNYPGLNAAAPSEYAAAMMRAVAPLVHETFGVNIQAPARAQSFFGIVTLPPTRMNAQQRRPHTDTTNPLQLAVLHYLCDESHGGTAFFRHRATGFESVDDQQLRQVKESIAADADAQLKAGLPPPVTLGDDRHFERTAALDSKFNRVLIYRSRVFHSQNLNPTANFSADPRKGRLTANTFITYPG